MSPKGRTWFFVLAVACAVIATVCPAETPGVMSVDDAVFFAKKLMVKCRDKGYPAPTTTLLNSIFNNSVQTSGGRTADQSIFLSNFLSTFQPVLNSVTANKNSPGQIPTNALEKMKNNMKNCSHLPAMIRMMKNSSELSVCYMEAFMAPLSWATLTSPSMNNVSSNDYSTLLSASRSLLLNVPSAIMNLPTTVDGQNMKRMMNTLQELHSTTTDEMRAKVLNWAKEQILQNNFSCTLQKLSNSKQKPMDLCKPSLKWLNLDALNTIGPYLTSLQPSDVDSSPSVDLCYFFRSGQLKSSMSRATRLNPSLAKAFLKNIQQCFSGNDFQNYVDKLGPLACYYSAPNLTPDLSKKLLPQLDNCDASITSKLKMDLINSMMSGSSSAQALRDLGLNVALLSPKQLAKLSSADVKGVLQNVGPSVQWSRSQMRTLAKKQLGDKKCGNVSSQDVMALQSVAAGLPSCVLKKLNAQEVLADTEALKNITKQMSKGQLKAMLEGLGVKVNLSELMKKLPGPLLRCVSLTNLDKANITSLDQVENKTWSLPQAAYLAKKMHQLHKLQYRRLNSVIQGVTCKMIAEVNDSQTLDMTQALTESPQGLSTVQARCAANKLLNSLERERTDYFKNITEQELALIPTTLLLLLPPGKVKDLPDSVCQVFLDKMQTANLSSLPLCAPSHPALIERALLCLTAGKNLSDLTSADVLRLGPLLCEMQPSKLDLMAPDVIKFSLQAMASCQHIPQVHRAELIQLLTQTFGSPSNWSAETMESMGPLILLDDNATSALPNAPWMRDVLVFLRPRLTQTSEAFKKKFFKLSTSTTASSSARRRRAATSSSNATEPTAALIEELGPDNVYWTASQLEMMSNSTFLAAVETLGSVPGYSSDQLVVLCKKALQVFGPVLQMNESIVMQLRCITQGFSNSDLEVLPFPLDSLDEISVCGWTASQIPSVWKGVANYNNLTASQLDAAQIVDLNRFICGLNATEIRQLKLDAFKEAVGSMNDLRCPVEVLQQLKQLAVSAFGNANTWTEAQVSDLKNIMAGLDANEMTSLDPSVFSFFSKTCIPQIPSQTFAALSIAQLEALGPDNAAMVTSKQRAALTAERLSVLDRTVTGSVGTDSQSLSRSGAPVLSVEGIYSFMKPVLLLLIGILLL